MYNYRDKIQKLYWYNACLLNCVKENVYYRIKDEKIQKILTNTNNDAKKIVKLLNCSEHKIRQHYIITTKLPNKLKNRISEKEHLNISLENAILNDPTFVLTFYSATSTINRLTEDKLNILNGI